MTKSYVKTCTGMSLRLIVWFESNIISVDHVNIHIGVEAAMTGVSRFGEIYPSWK